MKGVLNLENSKANAQVEVRVKRLFLVLEFPLGYHRGGKRLTRITGATVDSDSNTPLQSGPSPRFTYLS
jgi:hypothetical protein